MNCSACQLARVGFLIRVTLSLSIKSDDPPDSDYLYVNLHHEEAQQLRMRGRTGPRARKEASSNGSNRAYGGRPQQRRLLRAP